MSNEDSIGSLSLGSPNANEEQDRSQSTMVEENFWFEDDIWRDDNMAGNDRGAAGGPPQGDAPPPYPGNGQANAQGNNIMNMIEGLLQAQQQQHHAQIDTKIVVM